MPIIKSNRCLPPKHSTTKILKNGLNQAVRSSWADYFEDTDRPSDDFMAQRKMYFSHRKTLK